MEPGLARRKIPKRVETDVLVASGRRCCLCYYNGAKRDEVRGQIAHLDQRRDNSDFDNLAYLCFEHHDEYDTHRRQSKGLTIGEVKIHRDRLYKEIHARQNRIDEPPHRPDLQQDFAILFEHEPGLKELGKNWRLIAPEASQDFLFAYTSANEIGGIFHIHRRFLFDGRVLIICSQLPDNPGPSITNCVEELALQVCVRLRITSDQLVWVEHYGAVFGFKAFTRVSFSIQPPLGMFQNPTWLKMKKADWAALGTAPPKPLAVSEHRFF